MPTRRSLVAATALLMAAGFGVESRAEVVAETDAFGNYVKTSVLTQASVRRLNVWRTTRRSFRGLHPLNPNGDRFGDQFPTIAENPVDGNHPWVVWSRFNGSDYELVWSRWRRPGGWARVQWVANTPLPGDDLAPQMVFDGTGRPYVVWWRDEGGVGRVYLSFYLVTRWMSPLAVSDFGVDSRTPRVGIQSDGSIRVEFDTGNGMEARLVSFSGPTTITDDLNPISQLSVSPQNIPGQPTSATSQR